MKKVLKVVKETVKGIFIEPTVKDPVGLGIGILSAIVLHSSGYISGVISGMKEGKK